MLIRRANQINARYNFPTRRSCKACGAAIRRIHVQFCCMTTMHILSSANYPPCCVPFASPSFPFVEMLIRTLHAEWGPIRWWPVYNVIRWISATLPFSLYPSCWEISSHIQYCPWLGCSESHSLSCSTWWFQTKLIRFYPIFPWVSAWTKDFNLSNPLTSRSVEIFVPNM